MKTNQPLSAFCLTFLPKLKVASSFIRSALNGSKRNLSFFFFNSSAMQGRPGSAAGANQGSAFGFSWLPWYDVTKLN